jgi:hypothetical protein
MPRNRLVFSLAVEAFSCARLGEFCRIRGIFPLLRQAPTPFAS